VFLKQTTLRQEANDLNTITPFPKELVYSYISENAVIIEAGTHIGVHTIEMSSYKNCHIHAFEPVPHIFAQLEANT